MKISAVIITHNEADNIARCLESAQQVADEIIVVDSFSKDETKAICETYGVRFFERAFDGYGEQKNWGNAQANCDFILSLDADEVLSKTLIQDILKQKADPTNRAFRLNRLTNFSGTWVRFAGWYPDKKVRLWQKDVAVWKSKAVHEILEVKEGVKVGRLRGDLLHYSFNSVFDYMKRQNKYAQLSVIEQIKHGKKPKFLPSLFKGIYKFILLYFLKLGFIHGYHGLVICINGAGKYLINYAKYRQIEHSQTANQSQKGLPSTIGTAGKFSFLNLFKICSLISYYKNKETNTIEFSNYNDLKLGGIAAFWVGVPNVVYYSKEKIEMSLLRDFLFSTVITDKT